MKRSVASLGLALLLLSLSPVAAEETPGVYVILDGSGSMWGQLDDGTHKITAARDVLKDFVGNDFGGKELALRAYGHRREGDCADTELIVPFTSAGQAAETMRAFADQVNPKGKTPISRSLRAALADFGERRGEIILISDGIETCDEDPCELMRQWRESNVAIKVHVVGLGLSEKERGAMQCISEAAGTQYQDAGSAEELAAGLASIQTASAESVTTATESEPIVSEWQVLTIKATNAAGERMRVQGTAIAEGTDPIAVGNNGHNSVPPGTHEVTVGVRTRNGNLYRPVTQTVEVGTDGSTKVDFVVPEPPSVKAKFVERGEEVRGSHVTAYQDGEEVLSFRAKDRTHVDPGSYEFRAQPNDDNDLSVSETFADGDHKQVVFELAHTVSAHFTMVAAGTDYEFVSNFELWQDGELRYKVHRHNGVNALPGTYDLRLPLNLNPHLHEGVVLGEEDTQEYVIQVPVGHVTPIYEKADGSRQEKVRCKIEREKGERWVSDSITYTGTRQPLVPGRFRMACTGTDGKIGPDSFEVAVGEDKEIVLRAVR